MDKTIVFGIIILIIAFWFGAIMDIARSKFKKPHMNTVWLLAVLFFPLLGSIFYFISRKKYVKKEPRKFQPNFNKTE